MSRAQKSIGDRIAGEAIRLRDQLKMVRAMLMALEDGANDGHPVTAAAQSVADAAARLLTHAAKLDAYRHAGES